MDRILNILKKENGPRASSAPALGLNTIIFKYVYWYMKQISGERLQDHWSSGFLICVLVCVWFYKNHAQFEAFLLHIKVYLLKWSIGDVCYFVKVYD